MAYYSTIVITHQEDSTVMKQRLQAETGQKTKAMNRIMTYFASLAAGIRRATMAINVAAVRATGTITFSGVGAADDTILINGVTFTAKASGATGDEWNVGASATASAAALAAAINASASALVSGHVTASADTGVVTLTAINPGVTGNAITVAEGVDASSHMAVSGARLTGGTNGTSKTFTYGIGGS